MPHAHRVTTDHEPRNDATGRYSINAEISDLAGAVTALTADELSGISYSLNQGDSWDGACSGDHVSGSFLSNLF